MVFQSVHISTRSLVLVAALALVPALTAGAAQAVDQQVVVPAGADIQQAINANPEGTTFLLAAGIRSLSSTLVPKDGDSFVGAGQGQTILQAATSTINGFDSKSKVANVQIAGLTVHGFSQGIRTGPGWNVQDVEAAYNVIGIHMYGDNVVVSGCHVHHNKQFGVHGTTSVGQQMLGSDVSYNHIDSSISSGYAGGAKWVSATGVLVRGNDIHDNYGNGLWLDIEVRDATVTGNSLHGNTDEGLRVEISSGVLVEGNLIEGNGSAAVDVVNSHDVIVRGNTLVASAAAIDVLRFLGNGRRKSSGVEYANVNNRAESNTITLVARAQRIGVVRSAGTSYGNGFTGNTYNVPSLTVTYFKWWDGVTQKRVVWSAWRAAYGQDSGGSVFLRSVGF